MKNSKREITLNEADSLRDMLEAEKALARTYLDALWTADRKEVKELLGSLLAEVCADAFLVSELLDSVKADASGN